MAEHKIRILAVVGSTASGKSALAVAVSKALNGEVVSCDSMQIYRRMNIGTAKPTREEQDGVPHHLIDFVDPELPFSCAEYVEHAKRAVEEIAARGKLPILCGGTGLYLDALLRGGGFEETETDPAVRKELFSFAETHGNEALHACLAEIDPESAAGIHPNNVKRVVRAIEIYQTSGITKSEADRRSKTVESPYDATVIGLRYPDREVLYERIDRRVDLMLQAGLLAETESLLAEGVFEKNATAAQAIGYKELLGFLRGEESLDCAVESLKRATRRYAKRQMTWFGAKDYVHWIDMTQNGEVRSFDDVLGEALCLSRR
ncbi:MAG: tRNA (adenosine(37)-N6)-dimethylallyltransferase MiaA [Ruminococcaceae bacterium]|nr:tRNA (adenosine(37)-N6)-dimethylallyltransferase MiaA [Oscillospiraceae bacterium]